MNSREVILERIRINKPTKVALPVEFVNTNTSFSFIDSVTRAGGVVIEITEVNLRQVIQRVFPNAKKIVFNDEETKIPLPMLGAVDVAVINSDLGVSENGAVWIRSENHNRGLPFIAQHLAVVLNKKNIVATMHEAYSLAEAGSDYGVFISGPSKTADIEQSLVMGAHGARSMTILLTTDT
jgi:L-lactate dehydrogenase complex protein LldG